jgi:hypothetical protein
LGSGYVERNFAASISVPLFPAGSAWKDSSLPWHDETMTIREKTILGTSRAKEITGMPLLHVLRTQRLLTDTA